MQDNVLGGWILTGAHDVSGCSTLPGVVIPAGGTSIIEEPWDLVM